jgi:hypothetical protein
LQFEVYACACWLENAGQDPELKLPLLANELVASSGIDKTVK